MAMAAKTTIVQAHEVSNAPLDPNTIVTPGIFVSRVVEVESRTESLLKAQKMA